ncbi:MULTISPECIES: diacylglycerol kinase [Enterococcus]|jgi:diacylglycerol kinase (ATP)|uniref:Diacylglycerol kinase n=1 Tax=Enterococcus dispar ATCC 51266 TaxID=1139219 RepID=S1NYB7_9ENTE|nr:diacylglycerol kinase [Enterococcus dispar]EOT43401.1 diacylglycerol kinase [Enterococcus dispar ATCC 51266]EOW85151.1 diacylglycerol kinase [Enterococcus dispar ATCC 51266]MCU7358361.1 diacylglycerol kinase [Enterococcus dispar]MDT2706521.1 diacylglycerol kinase [Enterococcus dispar]OJG40045.1 diacylglycerol kinase [Enterococcus dispar]
MKKARVIYNPTSGKEATKRSLADILQVLEQAGFEASAFATTPEPNSAKNEATRAAKAGFDLIVAAGGDGTINEVVNGIAPLKKRPKMAIIPAGTTNDYARALKIPRDNLKAAAEVILKKQTIKMDIGQARENYFINIAAGGHLTELTYDVPSELKSIFGYLAYLAKGAELLPRVKPIKMHLKYDEGEYKGNASMFFLALTNSVGGFEQIAPDAKLDDGKFSLIIVKTANIFEIVHLVALMLNGGKHINDKRIIYTKTSHLEVDTIGEKNQLMINLDGEYGGDAPMTFVNHHHHIEMYANLDAIPDDAVVGYEEEEAEYEEVSRDFIKEVEKLTDEDIDGDGKIADQNDKK